MLLGSLRLIQVTWITDPRKGLGKAFLKFQFTVLILSFKFNSHSDLLPLTIRRRANPRKATIYDSDSQVTSGLDLRLKFKPMKLKDHEEP